MKIIYPNKTTKDIEEKCKKYEIEANSLYKKCKEAENERNEKINKVNIITGITAIITFLIIFISLIIITLNTSTSNISDIFTVPKQYYEVIWICMLSIILTVIISFFASTVAMINLKIKEYNKECNIKQEAFLDYINNLPDGYYYSYGIETGVNKYIVIYKNYNKIRKLEKLKEECNGLDEMDAELKGKKKIIIYNPNDELKVGCCIKCNIKKVYKDNSILDFSEL